MKIPKGLSEKEVLDAIEIAAKGLGHKYRFGYHSFEDMEQFARLEALDALENNKFDPKKGKLGTFLWTHVRNRLFNLKRNKFTRPDLPCLDCPLKAYDPHCEKSFSRCTAHNDKMNCEIFANWENRNTAKRNIISPVSMADVKDEHEKNMKVKEDYDNVVDANYITTLIDEKIPVNLRRSWIKMKTDINLPKQERIKLQEAIREILAEDNYGPA